jgi:hypothetical protein
VHTGVRRTNGLRWVKGDLQCSQCAVNKWLQGRYCWGRVGQSMFENIYGGYCTYYSSTGAHVQKCTLHMPLV